MSEKETTETSSDARPTMSTMAVIDPLTALPEHEAWLRTTLLARLGNRDEVEEVMQEVARVLRPGGRLVCTFSNRCFPTKAVRGWLAAEDEERPGIVQRYFAASGAFLPAEAVRRSEARRDPLWAVWATRR